MKLNMCVLDSLSFDFGNNKDKVLHQSLEISGGYAVVFHPCDGKNADVMHKFFYPLCYYRYAVDYIV